MFRHYSHAFNDAYDFIRPHCAPCLLPVVFGSLAIGCPLNTLDSSFGKTELIHMLKTTKPVLMFSDIDCYDLLTECLTQLGIDSKYTIFTFGGSKGDSEPVENLFAETHREDQFV